MAKKIALGFDRLTVRFGGLTAVDGFSFDVPQGSICSMIGPNGAGKTTAFNAATGIYEPASGRVLVLGREPSRPWTWKLVAMCVLNGLAVGLGLFLLAQNLDGLWRAAVKRRMADESQPFTYAGALADGLAYLRGDLALELRRGRWLIVTADGGTELRRVGIPREADKLRERLLAAETRRQAEQIRRDYEQIIALDGSTETLGQQNGRWVIRAPGEPASVLAEFPGREEAVRELERCAALGRARRARGLTAWALAALGLALGGAGTLAVWRRSRRTPDVITRGGIGRTFQNIRLFGGMTALENVLVGMERRFASGLLAMMLRTPGVRRGEKKARDRAMELLSWVRLAEQAYVLAKNLPYGAQRRLEIARALATKPRILMLDEPAAGMNPAEAGELMKLVRDIKRQGVTVLLIEHHMKFVMDISERIAVLDQGAKLAEGKPEEIRTDPRVIQAYLGQEELG